ncbi:MAG TPA: hypothetical protein K8W15_07945 [Gallibacterium anatis]|uniref:Uncharacterized protein n=1 Tax=Gallibacterium anatis TaxID=750 RepID=A0A921HA66_9PAST|nr:hypothetical protein [Gallibacterium anatis]
MMDIFEQLLAEQTQLNQQRFELLKSRLQLATNIYRTTAQWMAFFSELLDDFDVNTLEKAIVAIDSEPLTKMRIMDTFRISVSDYIQQAEAADSRTFNRI